jgi:hypothetical protein
VSYSRAATDGHHVAEHTPPFATSSLSAGTITIFRIVDFRQTADIQSSDQWQETRQQHDRGSTQVVADQAYQPIARHRDTNDGIRDSHVSSAVFIVSHVDTVHFATKANADRHYQESSYKRAHPRHR